MRHDSTEAKDLARTMLDRRPAASPILWTTLVLIISVSVGAAPGHCRPAPESNRAVEILTQALEAVGIEAFRETERLVLRYEGRALWEGQGASPQDPVRTRRIERVDAIDEANDRFARIQRTYYTDGTPSSCTHFEAGPDGGRLYDCLAHTLQPYPTSAGPGIIIQWRGLQVHELLAQTLDRAETLRSLGRRTVRGRIVNVASYLTEEGSQQIWYVDEGSDLPIRLEWVDEAPIYGPVTRYVEWSDYRDVGAFRFPFAVSRINHGGQSFEEHYLSVTPGVSDSLFTLPNGASERPAFGDPNERAVTALSDDVLLIMHAAPTYNVLVINTPTGLIVLDAPVNDEAGRGVLEIASEHFPSSSVRYVIPTHFHFDHVGGLAPFVEAGATVVTTAGNVEFLRQVVSSSAPEILTIRDGDAIGDGRVMLHVIDAAPHVDEMILPYLPQEKLLFVADLFMTESDGYVPPGRPGTIRFLRAVEALDLEIDRVVPAHGVLSTMDDVRTAVQRAPQAN